MKSDIGFNDNYSSHFKYNQQIQTIQQVSKICDKELSNWKILYIESQNKLILFGGIYRNQSIHEMDIFYYNPITENNLLALKHKGQM